MWWPMPAEDRPPTVAGDPANPRAMSSRPKTPSDPVASARSLHDLQQTVDHWIQTHGVRYFSELTNLAILMEEVGEVARIMARIYGEQSTKDGRPPGDLGDELADVLFVLVCLANQTGVDLEQAVRRNLHKKTKRDHQRHQRNPKLTS